MPTDHDNNNRNKNPQQTANSSAHGTSNCNRIDGNNVENIVFYNGLDFGASTLSAPDANNITNTGIGLRQIGINECSLRNVLVVLLAITAENGYEYEHDTRTGHNTIDTRMDSDYEQLFDATKNKYNSSMASKFGEQTLHYNKFSNIRLVFNDDILVNVNKLKDHF